MAYGQGGLPGHMWFAAVGASVRPEHALAGSVRPPVGQGGPRKQDHG